MREISKRRRSRGLPILLGLFLGLGAITVWEAASIHAGYSWTSDAGAEGTQRIRIRDGRRQLRIDLRGEVETTSDERGLARLGPGASLVIEERKRRWRRRLEASPGPDGEPQIAWFVDRKRADFDAEGHEWLARALSEVYRATGLDAERRVARLLASGGPDGVLAEIGKIPGDGVQRLYFEQLLAQAELGAEDLESVLRRMAREIGSDHEMGKLLAAIPNASLERDATADAFVAAAGTVGSDHELRRALAAHLESGDSTFAVCEALLDAAGSIGGDWELAELLTRAAAACPADRELPPGYARALRSIGTDFEQRRALAAAFGRPGLGAEELERLLATATGIGSDFDLAELLVELAASYPGRLPEATFRAAATLGTDYERRRVLSAVVARPDLDTEVVSQVLESARGIGSDHEMAQLLLELAERYPLDADLRPAFDRAVATIGNEYERQRILAAVAG